MVKFYVHNNKNNTGTESVITKAILKVLYSRTRNKDECFHEQVGIPSRIASDTNLRIEIVQLLAEGCTRHVARFAIANFMPLVKSQLSEIEQYRTRTRYAWKTREINVF